MKKIKRNTLTVLVAFFCVILVTCCKNTESCDIEIEAGPNAQQEIQTALNTVDQGCKVKLGDGQFELTNTLTMDSKSYVTIEGRSPQHTVLSFPEESDGTGGDGLLITNSDNIIVRDLTIRDTEGDALKFVRSNSIVMKRVNTVWSGEPSVENGAYGLYPVLSSNILIEECYAYGASDAGIYVGQSDKAIIRNSKAEGNVIGIEIENSSNSDVYDNIVEDNAAGILIINLPDLSQYGSRARVFDNTIRYNLRGNFAPPGSIPAEVPAGTGILTMSMTDVEIFDNDFTENNVVGTAVASYLALPALGLVEEPADPLFNPFPGNVYIHNNTFSRSNNYPEVEEQSTFGNFLVENFGLIGVPDIILDGIFAPGTEPSHMICMQENIGSSFINLNLPDFPNSIPSVDSAPHDCTLDPLPEVEITVPDF